MSKFFHHVNIIMGGRQEHWVERADAAGVDPLDMKLGQARAFLAAVYGAYPSGYVEVRAFPPKGGKVSKATCQDFFDVTQGGWQDALINRAFEQEYEGLDIYVGVLPRNRKRGRAEDVDTAAVLWADCDAKNITLKDVGSRGGDTADVVVQSGHGLHLYWTLPAIAPAEGITAALRGIQRKVGSDAVHDLSRVLRLPGTTNYKDPQNPRCARLIKQPKSI